MADVLSITFDHAQQRLKTPSNRISMGGQEMLDDDGDCMQIPGINTTIIRPYQDYLAWFTSNSGNYAKPTIGSGYEVLTPGLWSGVAHFNGAGLYGLCDNPAGEYIRTDATVGINRGMYLSFFKFHGGDEHVVLECGWSNSVTPSADTADIGIRIFASGRFELFKAGVFLNSYSVGEVHPEKGATHGPAQLPNELTNLFILPCRRRELVVWDNTGKSFTHVFDDIAENNNAPIITPDTKFFVVSPGGLPHLNVQFCPLTFPLSANAYSKKWVFATPPKSGVPLFNLWGSDKFPGITNALLYGDTAFAPGIQGVSSVVLRKPDDSGDFVADGVANQCVVKYTLSNDLGKYTPFLYGLTMQFEYETALTNSSQEFDATPFFTRATLSCPDDPFGCMYSLEFLMALESVDELGVESIRYLEDEVANLRTQSNRPVRIKIGDVEIMDGLLRKPKCVLEDSGDGYGFTWRFQCQVIPTLNLLEDHRVQTRLPFDGLPLCQPIELGGSVVSIILGESGVDPSKTRLSNLNYFISQVPHASCQEFNFCWELGETGRDVLEKAHRLCADCVYGPHPGVNGMELWFLAPDDLPSESAITLYDVETTVHDIFPDLPMDDAVQLLYSSPKEEVLALEANVIFATGRDPRTGRLFQSYARDDDSADPELAPDRRPPNWLGQPRILGITCRDFCTQDACDRCVTALVPIATNQPLAGEFAANTILLWDITNGDDVFVPVWRMDKITLDLIGDRRVSSMTGEHLKEVAEGERGAGYVRAGHYTTGEPRGKGGNTLAQIQANHEARMAQAHIQAMERNPLFATGILASNRVL